MFALLPRAAVPDFKLTFNEELGCDCGHEQLVGGPGLAAGDQMLQGRGLIAVRKAQLGLRA